MVFMETANSFSRCFVYLEEEISTHIVFASFLPVRLPHYRQGTVAMQGSYQECTSAIVFCAPVLIQTISVNVYGSWSWFNPSSWRQLNTWFLNMIVSWIETHTNVYA